MRLPTRTGQAVNFVCVCGQGVIGEELGVN